MPLSILCYQWVACQTLSLRMPSFGLTCNIGISSNIWDLEFSWQRVSRMWCVSCDKQAQTFQRSSLSPLSHYLDRADGYTISSLPEQLHPVSIVCTAAPYFLCLNVWTLSSLLPMRIIFLVIKRVCSLLTISFSLNSPYFGLCPFFLTYSPFNLIL